MWRDKPQHGISPINVQPFVNDGVMYGFDQNGRLYAVELPSGKRLWESETAKLVEVQIAAPAEPVRPAGTRSNAIEIRLKEGRSLVVEPGFQASHLRALLAVLESEA